MECIISVASNGSILRIDELGQKLAVNNVMFLMRSAFRSLGPVRLDEKTRSLRLRFIQVKKKKVP